MPSNRAGETGAYQLRDQTQVIPHGMYRCRESFKPGEQAIKSLAVAETATGNVVATCSVILPHPPAYFQGIREAWITSGTPLPPTDLMARSTSRNPKLWVVTFSSGKRCEASCCRASSHAL